MPNKLFDNVCDEAVFSEIYNKYSKDLKSYLYYKFGEALNPNDKMQDAFIKLLANCKKITPDKAKGFLYKVANNMMLNEIKHQKVVLRHKTVSARGYTDESPEFLMEQQEFLEKYQNALEQLPHDHRVAFLMNKVEGKSQAEIADILGITKKAVENRVYMAYKKLKENVEELKYLKGKSKR
ncbi:RNA polymerase sigma factor [Aquimarina intermedia]|uniref:RNA polymerase sigma-70 factor (ECF subfamily) n=1 Tax=Aquimarina intermedia TaxID=350814 RepID=A0A5S5BX06_9FLAO|nr:RNA polymerase sigma factor [Aquimarina intermedia]TYP70836.1 RNA polymerase sigma-70 factor (ECF subfamily) [Aquimarina intermedia]